MSEFRLYLADELVPLWQATEALAGELRPPPFWAFAWPGSLALARYLLDTPGLVTGKRVLDFGAGGGLAAVAAASCGAAHVLACDLDPLAQRAQRLNAALNDVTFESVCGDIVDHHLPRTVDVVLAGDVCYEREPSARTIAWLRRTADQGALVLLADPGRTYAPSDGLDLLATYDVPTLHELESVPHKRTRLWRIMPPLPLGPLGEAYHRERTLRRMTAEATALERFNGFSDEAIQFLLELQAEQSRTWFKAHQDDYARACRRPLELFVGELCERLADVYPGLTDAEPHFFRIQRDTRFAKNKEPYKTNIAADVPIRPRLDDEREHGVPGLYVSFGLEGEYVGIGAWHMTPAVLLRYRALLDHPRQGAQFQKLVDGLLARGNQVAAMEKLKRVPPPYAQDHPRAELLKHKGLAVMAQPEQNVSGSRRLLDWAEAELRAAAPLIHLLDKALARG